MAYTTIDDPSEYFTITLYTGSSNTAHTVTNSANAGDFKPDWLWIKNRSGTHGTRSHELMDSSRGANKALESDDSEAEFTRSGTNSFNTNGFTVGDDLGVNSSASPSVAWQWKANGGTTASNTDGDITSTVQANTEAGFSIVTYTGNGNASAQTVGHGLGSTCKLVLLKSRSIGDEAWRVFHESVSQSAGGNLFLNGTSGLDTGDPARITSTNTTTFTLDGYHSTYDAINEGSATYLAYCFAEKQGYSKIGSYNGASGGAFVYLGFKPSFLLVKRTNSAESWQLVDNKRSPINVMDEVIRPDSSGAENSNQGGGDSIDFLSNGFKPQSTAGQFNNVNSTYIYYAIAEAPLVSSKGVPTTAR